MENETIALEGSERTAEEITGTTVIKESDWYHCCINLNQAYLLVSEQFDYKSQHRTGRQQLTLVFGMMLKHLTVAKSMYIK